MRIASLALLPILALPASADLAQDAFRWAADIIDGTPAAPKSDIVHTMASWTWSDCGMSFLWWIHPANILQVFPLMRCECSERMS